MQGKRRKDLDEDGRVENKRLDLIVGRHFLGRPWRLLLGLFHVFYDFIIFIVFGGVILSRGRDGRGLRGHGRLGLL